MDYYQEYEEDSIEISDFDELDLDFNHLEERCENMKSYCFHNGLNLMTSKNILTDFIQLTINEK